MRCQTRYISYNIFKFSKLFRREKTIMKKIALVLVLGLLIQAFPASVFANGGILAVLAATSGSEDNQTTAPEKSKPAKTSPQKETTKKETIKKEIPKKEVQKKVAPKKAATKKSVKPVATKTVSK
jgi:outer membrane biosynthesis protein TonB